MNKIEEDIISITSSDCTSLSSSCSSPTISVSPTVLSGNTAPPVKFERSISASDPIQNENNASTAMSSPSSLFLRIYMDNSTTVVRCFS